MEEVKYILGDLVKLDGKLNVVIRPEVSDFGVIDIKTHTVTLCCIEDVEPIKLTPKILEANGWSQLDNAYGLYAFEHPDEEWLELILELDGWKAYCLDVGISDFFNSVHQLQHLLFGLGINHEMEV